MQGPLRRALASIANAWLAEFRPDGFEWGMDCPLNEGALAASPASGEMSGAVSYLIKATLMSSCPVGIAVRVQQRL